MQRRAASEILVELLAATEDPANTGEASLMTGLDQRVVDVGDVGGREEPAGVDLDALQTETGDRRDGDIPPSSGVDAHYTSEPAANGGCIVKQPSLRNHRGGSVS